MLPLLLHIAIVLLNCKQSKKLISALSKIWENNDGCAEQYWCSTTIYLMSVLSQRHSIIFDCGISAPGHVKEVVGGLNSIDKRYMYQLMYTVQLPGSKIFGKKIIVHSWTPKKDVSLAKEFQKYLSKDDRKNGVTDQGKDIKISSKRK